METDELPIRDGSPDGDWTARDRDASVRDTETTATITRPFPGSLGVNVRPAFAVLTSVLLVAACESGAAPTALSSASPATPSTSPMQSSSSSTCRLPVVIRKFDPTAHSWGADTAGFLTYPGGGFTSANASGVRYDTVRHLWLPAGIPTPDGAGYVYTDTAGAIHVVTLESGQDRILVAGSWVAIAFVGNGLYLAEGIPVPPGAFAGGGYREGRLARTDLSGAVPIFVTQRSGPWWVSSLGAWTTDRADGMQQAPDRVLHADLATGEVNPWLIGVGNVTIAGFDASGHPFVVGEGGTQILLVVDSRTALNIYSGARESGWPDSPYYVDGDKVWLSGFSIKDPTFEAPAWLYSPRNGLQASVGVPGAQVSVAGPCVR